MNLLLVFVKSNILKAICYHPKAPEMTFTRMNQANLLPTRFLKNPPPLPVSLIIPRRRNTEASITQFIEHGKHEKI